MHLLATPDPGEQRRKLILGDRGVLSVNPAHCQNLGGLLCRGCGAIR